MNKEQLEARKTVIANRISQIRRELTPVAYRVLAFQSVGFIAGLVWAWKTKQKWYIRPLAGIGGAVGANVLSTFLISNSKAEKTAEFAQLERELNDINGQLDWIRLQSYYPKPQ